MFKMSLFLFQTKCYRVQITSMPELTSLTAKFRGERTEHSLEDGVIVVRHYFVQRYR
jgi:hypothetical protein